MADAYQGAEGTQSQQQGQLASQLQTQSIIMMKTQELEERIDIELMQNPALELDDPSTDEEDASDLQEDNTDEPWDEDCAIPIDEIETGYHNDDKIYGVDDVSSSLERIAVDRWGDNPERLKKAIKAIDDHRQSGIMSDDILANDIVALESIPWNQNTFTDRPDIEVVTDNGQVDVCLVNNKGDYLKHKTGMGKDTIKAKKFIDDIQQRKRFLQKLCDLLLADLQRDFFLGNDFRFALLNLIPIQVSGLSDFIMDELFSTKLSLEKFIYRAEKLTVSCCHGSFLFNLFLPNKPSLLLLWIREAEGNGKLRQKEQQKWIIGQLKDNVSKWPADDRRRGFIQPLANISIDDIKSAKKKRSTIRYEAK